MNNSIRDNKDYSARINRVLDFIENNIAQCFTLEKLSEVANFSPYHFHRIFKIYTGETLNQFINRVRIERAATLLLLNKSKTITEIALECGFSGSAPFARAFRDYYGTSATSYRNNRFAADSKICKTNNNFEKHSGNNGKEFSIERDYFGKGNYNQSWRIKMTGIKNLESNVVVKEFKPFTVAYVRHIGPYATNAALFEKLFTKLFNWAGPRNLIREDAKILNIYHDNPDITEEDKLRLSVCLEVPEDTEVTGDIGKLLVPGGKYAVGHFELTPNDYGDAWGMMYSVWLPNSGYEPDDRACFELMLNKPKDHPEGKHIVDICISVKPAD